MVVRVRLNYFRSRMLATFRDDISERSGIVRVFLDQDQLVELPIPCFKNSQR